MMKVSNAYFRHPITGETIKPGEMYQDFSKGSAAIQITNTATEDEPDKEPDGEPDLETKFLSECSITELKKLAKDAKIAGYTSMDKDGLVAALEALAKKDVKNDDHD